MPITEGDDLRWHVEVCIPQGSSTVAQSCTYMRILAHISQMMMMMMMMMIIIIIIIIIRIPIMITSAGTSLPGPTGSLSGPISRDIAILSLRYPISRDTFLGEFSTPPKWCDTPPWYLVSHRHICAIPHFATYRAIIVRYPMKTSTKMVVRYYRYKYCAI